MKKKILLIIIFVFALTLITRGVYAASASISASNTSVSVGTKVTVTVKINAAAWNLHVSGSATDAIVGANLDAENTVTTKTYSITPTETGTYKITLNGDITDENSDTATSISKSVTITATEKTSETSTQTNKNTSNTNDNKKTTTSSKTTTTKSSNANISKLTLNVEGLSFKSNQTTYDIKVGTDVEDISVGVTLSHAKATYTVDGNKNLKFGNNVIKIVVTAEDGTNKTYKINVNREGNIEDISSQLSNLIIEGMTFDKEFVSTETEYVGNPMKYVEKLNILPFAVSEKATYEIIGNENFKEGENTVIVKVTSYDKSSTTEYKVTFEMKAKEEIDALQKVSIYEEQPSIKRSEKIKLLNKVLSEHATVIWLYILALVEFAQVIYLYIKLEKVNPDAVKVKRRNNNKNNN